MIKKRCKRIIRLHKKNNQGNSFIMVVATLSFLAVLVAAILVAVALCYRLKAYDINARDNFYYLEEAMDEIYAGVGSDAMKHLNEAYQETIEILVYYDAESKSYVTMENSEANTILKNSYMRKIKDDDNYKTKDILEAHLNSFLSNPYVEKTYDKLTHSIETGSDVNPEGIELSIDNVVPSTENITIYSLVLKREATYSTVNTRKSTTTDAYGNTVTQASAGDTFVQTITTDLVINKPEFDVDFNTIGSELSNLYSYSLIADKGIEILGQATSVNITGNLYAAADFYNKSYNKIDLDLNDEAAGNESDEESQRGKPAKVCSYTSNDEDGLKEKSMYSGIYIDGSSVVISSDMVVVPGTIAAFNGASVSIAGSNQETASASNLWADNITLGGYSLKKIAGDENSETYGSTLSLRANAYISDDLELNAEASKFSMVGNYYGYNYASTDNRTYSDTALGANRTFVDAVKAKRIKDGSSVSGQAHYNSSAIIVNGQNSSLDLRSVDNMYIAGQSYIETSKVTATEDKDGDDHAYTVTYTDTEGTESTVNISKDTYKYPQYDTAAAVADNYTTTTDPSTLNDAAPKESADKTDIQDYRTGEAISIKSNQLAYFIPPEYLKEDVSTGDLYVELPNSFSMYKKYWKEISKIPVIKTVISGKKYYFFDFSTAATPGDTLDATNGVMNSFIADYAKLFEKREDGTSEGGDLNLPYDIVDYEPFKIKMLAVNTTYTDNDSEGNPSGTPVEDDKYTHIYSNSAITVKTNTSFTIMAKSDSIDPLTRAASMINAEISAQKDKMTDSEKSLIVQEVASSSTASVVANSLTSTLQAKYKEAKYMLSTRSSDVAAIQYVKSDLDEDNISPINYYFKFNKIIESGAKKTNIIERLPSSGFKLWITADNVKVSKDDFADGNVKGVIITKGNVEFEDNVKSFEGMIIAGGKIIVEHSMNIASNDEIIKTVLRECDESILDSTKADKKCHMLCEILRHYVISNTADSIADDGTLKTVSAKNISAVQYEDILSFKNWKKNVD